MGMRGWEPPVIFTYGRVALAEPWVVSRAKEILLSAHPYSHVWEPKEIICCTVSNHPRAILNDLI